MPRAKYFRSIAVNLGNTSRNIQVYQNTFQGREKYIFHFDKLISSGELSRNDLFNLGNIIKKIPNLKRIQVVGDTLEIILMIYKKWEDVIDNNETIGGLITRDITKFVQDKLSTQTAPSTPNFKYTLSDFEELQDGDEIKYDYNYLSYRYVIQNKRKVNGVVEVVVHTFVDDKFKAEQVFTYQDIFNFQTIKEIKNFQLVKKSSQPVTSDPATKLTRNWKSYFVMPKTGITIYQDQNAVNKNYFDFFIPVKPKGRDKIDTGELKDFILSCSILNYFQGGEYRLIKKSGFLKEDSYEIEFFIGRTTQSILEPLPPLNDQEKLFKEIDEKLINRLLLPDLSPSQVNANKFTLEDIKALEEGDLVIVQPLNITLKIIKDVVFEGEPSKLSDMKDNQDGSISENVPYPLTWFLNYDLTIIKRDKANDVFPDKSVKQLTIQEEELQKAKKELSQLLILKSFTSPIDFERKIQINQKISEVEKKINDLNFKIIERRSAKDDIFEDLFEQSFTPINNTYQDVFAAPLNEGQPASSQFFAPDGAPSKLSDQLNELIRTPEFLEWFGNWQLAYAYRDEDTPDITCSKVVTEDFEPMVVWHGTGQQFSYFRFDTFPAAYFAVNWKYSKWFADLHGGGSGYTIPFFLNIRNPLDLTRFGTRKVSGKEFFDYLYLQTGMNMVDLEVNPIFMDSSVPPQQTWVYLRNNAKMLKNLSENHVFDGIHFYETNPNVPEGESAHQTEAYIIFNPEQCKVADPNRGMLMFASLKSFLLKKGGKI